MRFFGYLRLCLRIVTSRWFDYAIGCVILINSLLVGLEVQWSLSGGNVEWMQPLDTGFIALYFLELCMRLVGIGFRQCFCDGWFLLDFTLDAWQQDECGQLQPPSP